MRLSVLGACGAWPQAGEACSGFLVEQDGFRLLLDLGYATFPRLVQRVAAEEINALFVSHGHPDHCADLSPLLRARALGGRSPAPLPVYAPPGALDAVLGLDRAGMLDDACVVHELGSGASTTLGPFQAETVLLPHSVPNLGIRLVADGRTLVYTGDSGPSRDVVDLARDADLLLAEATHPDLVPEDLRLYLTNARTAGRQAAQARVDRLLLTHLWPGTDARAAVSAAAETFGGTVDVAVGDLTVDL